MNNLIEHIHTATITDGGITIDPATENVPADGFVVSRDSAAIDPATGTTNGIIVRRSEFIGNGRQIIAAYISARSAILSHPDTYVGTWADGDDIYIDTVLVVGDRDAAIYLGRQNNQIAVWDISNATTIDTDGDGGRDSLAA